MIDQASRDQWQTRLYEAVYGLSVSLKELHEANPWPENPVLGQAINTLATELWDRGFSQMEIQAAFGQAIVDLPRYTADLEYRP